VEYYFRSSRQRHV